MSDKISLPNRPPAAAPRAAPTKRETTLFVLITRAMTAPKAAPDIALALMLWVSVSICIEKFLQAAAPYSIGRPPVESLPARRAWGQLWRSPLSTDACSSLPGALHRLLQGARDLG